MTRTQIFQASTEAFRKALQIGMTIDEAEGVSYRVYAALVEANGGKA